MRARHFQKKLNLKKRTVSNLQNGDMHEVRGGAYTAVRTGCPSPTSMEGDCETIGYCPTENNCGGTYTCYHHICVVDKDTRNPDVC